MKDLLSDNNHRVPVVKDFWYKTEDEPDTTLYNHQLGWTVTLQVESGGYTDTHDVWRNLMERTSPDIVGWDLCFFYPPTGTFYYIDQMAKVLYKLPFNDGRDGKYIFEGVDVRPHLVPEDDELLDFENVSEVWDKFTIDGKDMKYIIEHSALFLGT